MGSASRFVVFVTALAFAFQCYLTQTHIHGMLQGDAVKIAAALSSTPDKTPLDHSRSDCPVCQAVVHAGAFLAPVVLPVLVLSWTEHAAPFVAARIVVADSTHFWQSRAPPRR
jgi:hypothetical protein